MSPYYEDGGLRLFHSDNREVLGADALGYPHALGYHPDRLIPDNTFDSIVTDPPYELGFMGKGWDSSGIAYDVDMWRECLRVLKPGGFLLSFGGTRTWHRIAVAIEDAGFEIRDSIAWMYGSGFPKSMNVAKAIESTLTQGGSSSRMLKATELAGDGVAYTAVGKNNVIMGASVLTERKTFEAGTDEAKEWEGWGTALKPAFEPIVVARKPLIGTVAANVLEHGTGALNIDACRVAFASEADRRESTEKNQHAKFGTKPGQNKVYGDYSQTEMKDYDGSKGRFPSNVLLDGAQADALDEQTGVSRSRIGKPRGSAAGDGWGMTKTGAEYDDEGGASRFFPTFRYEAKAPGSERPEVDGVAHATVKPLDLMRWLVRLVTRRGGHVLDPFAGSGTTGEAALLEGMDSTLIELESAHLPLIMQRVHKPLQPSMFGDWEESA